MTSISTQDYTIYFNENCYSALNEHIKSSNYSTIFILVDEITNKHCLPKFLQRLECDNTIEILEVEHGEINKSIDTCISLWNALSELNADRKSLVLNLGGGVITDMGGFIASTFKRGISFINIPTTLLAMVDASIGGKTGVDLGNLKNQIGVINTSEMVLIDTSFLDTLPQNEMRSGLAEMLKHGLIYSEDYWDKMKDLSKLSLDNLDDLIFESIEVKKHIVEQDPNEQNIRKTLNYGHTLGHAIESYFLTHKEKTTLLHGEAIAIGMVLETYLSKILLGFSSEKNEEIKQIIKKIYGHVSIEEQDYAPIIDLMKYDKKNEHGNINFVLLESIGNPKINCTADNDLIINAFKFYNA